MKYIKVFESFDNPNPKISAICDLYVNSVETRHWDKDIYNIAVDIYTSINRKLRISASEKDIDRCFKYLDDMFFDMFGIRYVKFIDELTWLEDYMELEENYTLYSKTGIIEIQLPQEYDEIPYGEEIPYELEEAICEFANNLNLKYKIGRSKKYSTAYHIVLYKKSFDKHKIHIEYDIIVEKKHLKTFENYDNLSGVSIEDKLRYICLIYGSSICPQIWTTSATAKALDYIYNKYSSMETYQILDIHTDKIDKSDEDSIDEWCRYLMNLFKETYGIDYRVFEDEFILITDYTDIQLNYAGIIYDLENKKIEIELPDDEYPNFPFKKRTWRILEDRDYLSDFANRIGLKWSCSLHKAIFTKI